MTQHRRSPISRLSVVMMFCVVLAVAGCASSTATPSTTNTAALGSGSPSAAAPTGQTPTPQQSAATGSGTPRSAVQLAFTDNGRTITLHVGGTLHVVLDSAFWTFKSVPETRLLKIDATGYASASPGTCVGPQAAGAGCGSQTADYTALAVGRTSVVATRVQCGEAMRCTGPNALFQVQIIIVN